MPQTNSSPLLCKEKAVLHDTYFVLQSARDRFVISVLYSVYYIVKVHGLDMWYSTCCPLCLRSDPFFLPFFQSVTPGDALPRFTCWIISLITDWTVVWNHPIRNMTGHLNPCFGWDYPPASYFAVMFAAAGVFLDCRYANLEAT